MENKHAIYREYFAKLLSYRLVYLLAQPPDATLVSGARTVPGHVCCRCLRWQTSVAGRHTKSSPHVPGMQRKRLVASVEYGSQQDRG